MIDDAAFATGYRMAFGLFVSTMKQFPAILLFSLLSAFPLSGLAEGKLEKLTFQYEVLLENVRQESASRTDEIYTLYAGAVERLQKSFQESGDLENSIKARDELTLAKEKRKSGKVDFPGIADLRLKLKTTVAEINSTEKTKRNDLTEKYLASLDPLVTELTKAGNIEEALKVKAAIEKLKATKTFQQSPLAPPSEAPEMATSITLANTPGGKSILDSKKGFNRQETLKPGIYRGFERVIIGDRTAGKGKEKGALTISAGSEIIDGTIYSDVGPFKIESSVARDIAFQANLHGDFFADNSIFDRCTFEKAGGWFSGVSSRWRFNNCVIHGSFFKKWTKKLVGVQIRFTTFEDIQFVDFTYREDAGKEAADGWSVYERCLFRNCEIPESILIATKDCVFEDCTFKTGAGELPAITPLEVTVYNRGIRLSLPTDRDKITYIQLPESNLGGVIVGSQLEYKLSDRTLKLP